MTPPLTVFQTGEGSDGCSTQMSRVGGHYISVGRVGDLASYRIFSTSGYVAKGRVGWSSYPSSSYHERRDD